MLQYINVYLQKHCSFFTDFIIDHFNLTEATHDQGTLDQIKQIHRIEVILAEDESAFEI